MNKNKILKDHEDWLVAQAKKIKSINENKCLPLTVETIFIPPVASWLIDEKSIQIICWVLYYEVLLTMDSIKSEFYHHYMPEIRYFSALSLFIIGKDVPNTTKISSIKNALTEGHGFVFLFLQNQVYLLI